MTRVFVRRMYTRALHIGLLVLLAAACGNDVTPPEEHNNVGELRITIGPQVALVYASGNIAALNLPAGTHAVTIAPFNPMSEPTELLEDDTSIEITSANEAVARYTAQTATTGTLTTAPGTTELTVRVAHMQHTDFGPRTFTVNVQ